MRAKDLSKGGVVKVWTSTHGKYFGIVQEWSGKPARVKVKIIDILRYAEKGRRQYLEGEIIEVGIINIEKMAME